MEEIPAAKPEADHKNSLFTMIFLNSSTGWLHFDVYRPVDMKRLMGDPFNFILTYQHEKTYNKRTVLDIFHQSLMGL